MMSVLFVVGRCEFEVWMFENMIEESEVSNVEVSWVLVGFETRKGLQSGRATTREG